MGGIASPDFSTLSAVNPILAEIDAAHARLSPDAQAAIEKAHGIAPPIPPAGIAAPNGPATEPPPGGGIQAPAPTTVGAGITPPGAAAPKLTPVNPDAIPGVSEPAQDAASDNVSSAVIKPPAVPSLGSKMPETPAIAPIGTGKVSPELARITAPDNHRHDKTNTGTPGDNQIHNPWLRVPVQILDALGRGFFPGVEMAIPGTSGHHDVLVHQRQVEDTEERAAQNEAAKRELEEAQAQKDLHPGETKDWQEIAGGAIDPAHPELGPQPAFYNKNDPGQGIKFGNASLGKKENEKHDIHSMYADAVADAQKRGVDPKDDPKVQQTLAAVTALNKEPTPSKPDVHVILADKISDALKRGVDPNEDPSVQQVTKAIRAMAATPNDTEIIHKEINGKPHNVMVKKSTGETVADLGELGEKPPTININAEQKPGRTLLDKAEATYRTAQQSATDLRNFISMAQSGNKVTAQALPLEGTLAIVTSQGVKRINRTEVEYNQAAGSLFDKIMGEVGKLGSGQPIPPNIMKDWSKLADMMEKTSYETYKGAFDSAKKRYHLTDEEPLPEPKGSGAGVPQPKSKAEYDALPKGAHYMKDGQEKIKQ